MLTVALSLLLGARTVSLSAIWQALTAFDPASADHVVIRTRVDRTAAGVVVGAALALAGTAMQGLTRNPLADPGILGLNAGAATAVVIGVYAFSITAIPELMACAFLGAALGTVAVYALASRGREGATPVKLALCGAAITAGLGSVVNALVLLDQSALDRLRFWQIGTLGARTLADVTPAAIAVIIGIIIVLGFGPTLNALALGDDAAVGLGVRLTRARIVLGAAIVLLCGAAVALAGPIGFLGLVVPHAVRIVVGADHRRTIPVALFAGPILILLADVAGRLIAPPAEVQVGVMTALIGVPVFILLIRTGKRVSA